MSNNENYAFRLSLYRVPSRSRATWSTVSGGGGSDRQNQRQWHKQGKGRQKAAVEAAVRPTMGVARARAAGWRYWPIVDRPSGGWMRYAAR